MSSRYHLRPRKNTLPQKRKLTHSEESTPSKRNRTMSAPSTITTSKQSKPEISLEACTPHNQTSSKKSDTDKVAQKEKESKKSQDVYDSDCSLLSSRSNSPFTLKKPFYKTKNISCKEVNSQLRLLGLDPDRVCLCVKASVRNCYISLSKDGDSDPLDQVTYLYIYTIL